MRELERDLPTNSATAPEAARQVLAIVGAGRVGSSIATAAEAAGLTVRLAGRRNAAEACEGADAVLLCVPDEAIAEAAAAIAGAGVAVGFAGHTSGASTLAELKPLGEAGSALFSIHPLQTVPDGDSDLTACPAAIAGSDGAALGFARELAERLGMRPFAVDDDDRAAYHAAAAIASNFLVALQESAVELLERTGVEDARELLAPLVLRTAANWSERGAGALTGPIARGDEATVERHLEALREAAPELTDLYEVLAERTRAHAAREQR